MPGVDDVFWIGGAYSALFDVFKYYGTVYAIYPMEALHTHARKFDACGGARSWISASCR